MDRNILPFDYIIRLYRSLSARRAWIEMLPAANTYASRLSLSARRAWIEIIYHKAKVCPDVRRSPQGERG